MMDRVEENPAPSIGEQAAEWLIRWQCGDLSIAERFEYLQWLKTSPVHIAETLRMCRLYSWLEGTKLKLYITNEDHFSNVVELPPREHVAPPSAEQGSTWRSKLVAGLAAIGLTVLVGFGAKVSYFDRTIETQISEWRSLPLTDGTVVVTGPSTRLRYDMAGERRLVELAKGEAMFNVAKDTTRPFLVDAGLATVKVTGTRFSVDRYGDEVVVTVREGSVVVMPPSQSASFDEISLTESERVIVSRSGVTAVQRIDPERAFAWTQRRLQFQYDKVRDAAEQFNRRNRLQIEVDPVLGEKEMRGVFDADDPQSFVDFLLIREGVSAVRDESGATVRLKQRGERRQ